MMEEDPLIPLVHMWSNAAFDRASSPSSAAWRAQAAAGDGVVRGRKGGDKENHRPAPDAASGEDDVEAEIGHIEAEILRLSSRLHHLRTAGAKQPEPKRGGGEDHAPKPAGNALARPRPRGLSMGPLEVIAAAAANPNPLSEKQQQAPQRAAWGLKPAKQQPPAPSRGRGYSLGPLDIAAANPRVVVPAASAPPQRSLQGEGASARSILKPIKEPPVQRRRGVSLGPLEIHRGVGSKPAAAAAATRVKQFPSKLSAVCEEGQQSKPRAVPAKPWPSSNARQGTAASRAKARSGSMSPRSRRQSTAKAIETRGGSSAVGANKVADELKPKGVVDLTGSGASGKRPSGSSKVRMVPSRYSLMPGSSSGAGTQEKRRKQSLPGSAGGPSQREEIRATVSEPGNDEITPETISKLTELLPRIRTMKPYDESPRDSGCAKRVADLVGKRSFFNAAAADDDNAVTPFQARVLEVESPEPEAVVAEEEA